MQWANNGNAELDRLRRFCIAYEYVQVERIKDNATSEVEQVKAKLAEIDDIAKTTQVEVKEMETKIAQLTAKKEASMGGEVKSLAEKVGKENAEVVLSLVGYEEELRSAMEYIFGSTFVCKTIDAAKEGQW